LLERESHTGDNRTACSEIFTVTQHGCMFQTRPIEGAISGGVIDHQNPVARTRLLNRLVDDFGLVEGVNM
jgi:hypothetical protein